MKTETIDYQQQAQAFLERFGIKFRATLSNSKVAPWAEERKFHRLVNNITEPHHYRVTLSRQNGLVMYVDCGRVKVERPTRLTFDFWGSIKDAEDGKHPTAYDVLACMSSDANCAETFEDFCGEFGESADSIKALQTFRRCSAFARRLRAFFTAEELEALGEIQ